MTRRSLVNFVLLVFSLLGAAGVFLTGELLLRFLPGLPFMVQTGVYLTLALVMNYGAIFAAEKVRSGHYIPRGRVTFNSTCAKAAAVFIPLAFVLGLLSQLIYGAPRFHDPYAPPGEPLPASAARQTGVEWWNVRHPEHADGTSPIGTADGFIAAHASLQGFFLDNRYGLQDRLDDFAVSILGPGATISDWLGSVSPTVPARAPPFMTIGEYEVPLAFRAALEYAYGAVLDRDILAITGQPQVEFGYNGPHGREFALLWEVLNAWTRDTHDACEDFHDYWSRHIMQDPRPLSPALIRHHLLLRPIGPGAGGALRIALAAGILALWGVFLGVATVVFLNNNKLVKNFLVPRIVVSIVVAAGFVVMMMPDYDLSMPARGLLAAGLSLLVLPTFSWDSKTF